MEDLRILENLVNEESEMVILGTILDNQVKGNSLEEINSDIFSKKYHKDLFDAMRAILRIEDSIDIQLVHQQLKKISSPLTIVNLTNLLTWSNKYTFKQHLDILNTLHQRRKIYERATRLAEGILEGNDIDKLMYDFEEDTKKDAPTQVHDDSIQAICSRFLEQLESPITNGIKFGIPLLDDTIGGIFPGELTTIGAKSGVGKTALALNIVNSVLAQDKTVLIITREMTDNHILQRMLSQTVGVNTKAMKTHTLDDEGWNNVIQGLGYMGSKKLYINDTISKPSEIRHRIKQLKPDLVVVDYLQLLTSDSKNSSREQEVAKLSREMKNITLDFNCAVIQLTQLNDAFKGMPFGESAVRESRSIYHDSNNVIYLHKPMDLAELTTMAGKESVAKVWLELNQESSNKIMQLIVSKCRDGNTKIDKYWYIGSTLTFKEFNFNDK